jgi:hypothetical protein cdivTM_27693
MGGINCPPFREGEREEISKELLATYTDRLARYCHALFSGSASFFAANVAIEKAVLSGTGKVSDAIEKLEASENMLGEAMTNLGSVASMWAMISDKSIAFGNQQRLLVAAVSKVQIAKMELMAMSVKGSLQQSLWRNSALTESFTRTLLAINATTAWQSGFARTFASVSITA